jgi:hypothetical protein
MLSLPPERLRIFHQLMNAAAQHPIISYDDFFCKRFPSDALMNFPNQPAAPAVPHVCAGTAFLRFLLLDPIDLLYQYSRICSTASKLPRGHLISNWGFLE